MANVFSNGIEDLFAYMSHFSVNQSVLFLSELLKTDD